MLYGERHSQCTVNSDVVALLYNMQSILFVVHLNLLCCWPIEFKQQ